MALSPVYRQCRACGGAGHIHPAPTGMSWLRCTSCDGVGHEWIDGAPLFGCKMLLSERRRGEIVTIGNGDRGRIQWHTKGARPITFISLIGDFDDRESTDVTMYPSCVGIISVADPRWYDDSDQAGGRTDNEDPMRKQKL